MSVYREPARRRARAAAVAALIGVLSGALVGYIVGRETVDEPTLDERVGELQDRVRPALNALELVGIEYSEAVRGGRVVAETEYLAAQAQAERVAATLDDNREELDLISARETAAAERSLEELERRIADRVDSGAVRRTADASAAALAAAARLSAAR